MPLSHGATSASNPSNPKTELSKDAVLRAAMSHWIHEDNLYWAKMRYLLSIQIAGIVSWYALKGNFVSIIIMIIVIIVTFSFFILSVRIMKNRDVNEKWIKTQCREIYEDFNLATHQLGAFNDAGRRFQIWSFILCFAIDVMLIYISYDKMYGTGEFFKKLELFS